ncbi:hypothetical protein BH10PLA2_BH10PLA2_09970 [soil metagenome]
MWPPRHSCHLVSLLVVTFLSGCTESRRPSTGAERSVALAMPEVQDLYFSYQKAEGKPPAKLADLDKLRHAFANGYRAIQSGEIVVIWGAVLAPEVPIAYEKETPETGGLVLFGTGVSKNLSAEAFNALKK